MDVSEHTVRLAYEDFVRRWGGEDTMPEYWELGDAMWARCRALVEDALTDEREVLIRRIAWLMLDAPLPDFVEDMLQHREYGIALEELAAWINAEKGE